MRLPARRLNARRLREAVAEARTKRTRAGVIAEELRSAGGPTVAADILERTGGIKTERRLDSSVTSAREALQAPQGLR